MNILVLVRFSKEIYKEEIVPLLWAKLLKKKYNAKIYAMTMDNISNGSRYKSCFEWGADKVIVLSDKRFAGADTLSTSRTIARAIKMLDIDFDIIITSSSSTSGETGQVPVSVSNFLGINYCFNVTELQFDASENFRIIEKFENFYQSLKVSYPILLSMSNNVNELFYKTYQPTLYDIVRVSGKRIEVYDMEKVNITEEECGLLGSRTRVIKCEKLKEKKEHIIIERDIDRSKDEIKHQIEKVMTYEKNINSI